MFGDWSIVVAVFGAEVGAVVGSYALIWAIAQALGLQ